MLVLLLVFGELVELRRSYESSDGLVVHLFVARELGIASRLWVGSDVEHLELVT